MNKFMKKAISLMCIIAVLAGATVTAFAHSGRTDSSGGHRDNRNASGLGSYHYHCGGYPAHLHEYGYCPYTDVFPKSVKLKAEKTSLAIDETSVITATVSPSNACSTSVSWSSSDTSIIRVSNGKITAVGFGTATITASTFNDKVGSIKITVKEIVADSIDIVGFTEAEEGASNVLYIGDKHTLSAKILPENVDNPTVTWTSSNPEIISVEEGNIEALKEGTASVTAASSNGKTDTIAFTVEEVVAEKIEIKAPDAITMRDKVKLSVQFFPANTSYKEIEWKSSNPNVLTVDKDGNIKAVSVGTAAVTAVQKDVQTRVSIEVQPIGAERIDISAPTDFEGKLSAGDSTQLTADIFPEDVTYTDITWTSNNPEVVTVDETGVVTAVSAGMAVITATSADGVEASVQLRVPSILIPAVLIAIALLVVLGAVLMIMRTMKNQNNGADEAGNKVATKKSLMLGGIAILLLAAVAVAGYFFSLSGKYERAVFLANSGRPAEAVALFKELGGYKDAEEQFALLLEQDAGLAIQFAQPGETIKFGQYEQDEDFANGKEPLEWIVLKNDGDTAMLVSKCIIDTRPYVEIETEDGWDALGQWNYMLKETEVNPFKALTPNDGVLSLYEWLYTTFSEDAFSECNTAPVKELRLLTRDEVEEHIGNLQDPEWTEYAGGGGDWWMDDVLSFNGSLVGRVVTKNNAYSIDVRDVDSEYGIRPLILYALK